MNYSNLNLFYLLIFAMLILTLCQDSYEDDESPEEQIVGRAPSVNKQKRVGLFFGTEEKQNENF